MSISDNVARRLYVLRWALTFRLEVLSHFSASSRCHVPPLVCATQEVTTFLIANRKIRALTARFVVISA